MNDLLIGRSFQTWIYTVRHGQLLIRSQKTTRFTKNVDVMFFNVTFMELPRYLPDMEIEIGGESDLLHCRERVDEPDIAGHVVFVVKSRGRRYMVVAAGVQIVESNMDAFASPFDMDASVGA